MDSYLNQQIKNTINLPLRRNSAQENNNQGLPPKISGRDKSPNAIDTQRQGNNNGTPTPLGDSGDARAMVGKP